MTQKPKSTPTVLIHADGYFLSNPCKVVYITNEDFPLVQRACNAHDDLVLALEEAHNQLRTNQVYYAGCKPSNERTNMTSAAILIAGKALAKAKAVR